MRETGKVIVGGGKHCRYCINVMPLGLIPHPDNYCFKCSNLSFAAGLLLLEHGNSVVLCDKQMLHLVLFTNYKQFF